MPSDQSYSDPPVIASLRECAAKDADSFGVTLFCPAGAASVWRILHIRPELLTEHENGDRVYRVTPAQASKALRVWEGGSDGGS